MNLSINLVCSTRNLLIAVILALVLIIGLFALLASPFLLFAIAIPIILGVAFLALWALTTTTTLGNNNTLFVIVYIVTLVAIEGAIWWTYCQHDDHVTSYSPSASKLLTQAPHMEVQDEKYHG